MSTVRFINQSVLIGNIARPDQGHRYTLLEVPGLTCPGRGSNRVWSEHSRKEPSRQLNSLAIRNLHSWDEAILHSNFICRKLGERFAVMKLTEKTTMRSTALKNAASRIPVICKKRVPVTIQRRKYRTTSSETPKPNQDPDSHESALI